jgi:hypothetical protein
MRKFKVVEINDEGEEEVLIEGVDNIFYSGLTDKESPTGSKVFFGGGITEINSAATALIKHTFSTGINEVLEDMQAKDKPELSGMENLDETMEDLMKDLMKDLAKEDE